MALARLSFTNLKTEETRAVQLNPERVRYVAEANYAELRSLGLSHEPEQFESTKNVPFEFSLIFDALLQEEWDSRKISDTLNFLESLVYPVAGDRVGSIAPPMVALYWPRYCAVKCRMGRVEPETTRWAENGAPTRWEVKVQLKQVLLDRTTSEDVRRYGVRRVR